MLRESARELPVERCSQCRARLEPNDRFCPVCGTARTSVAPAARSRRRGRELLIGGGGVLLLVFAAVAWIYFSAPERHQSQAVAQLTVSPPFALGVFPGAQPAAVVGATNRLVMSGDAGTTWQSVPIQGSIAAIAVPNGSSPVAYLGGNGFWRQSGASLQDLSASVPGAVTALTVDPADASRVFALIANQGLYQSDDAGAHWALISSDVPPNATSLAIGAEPTNAFFVGTAGSGVFSSSDGRAWGNASGFVNGALPSRMILALVSDPQSGDRYTSPSGQTITGALYAGTDQGIFKSIDGGVSWTITSFHTAVAALALSPGGSRTMLVLDASGHVFRSTDAGVSWQ